ncbi:hypothetical protein THTE_0627 [Thermogutta terrifontis]|uniref:Uncharacterized protein n=1 Tax=Thermogutta terrifontis TaxID=1331910 RepID=A0A286RBB8_9BACT|nr:hypothetical protein THTE_0627 [Thermogutta terrifontis]
MTDCSHHAYSVLHRVVLIIDKLCLDYSPFPVFSQLRIWMVDPRFGGDL